MLKHMSLTVVPAIVLAFYAAVFFPVEQSSMIPIETGLYNQASDTITVYVEHRIMHNGMLNFSGDTRGISLLAGSAEGRQTETFSLTREELDGIRLEAETDGGFMLVAMEQGSIRNTVGIGSGRPVILNSLHFGTNEFEPGLVDITINCVDVRNVTLEMRLGTE